MKVKYIKSEKLKYGTSSLESEINNFIKDKEIIDIKFQEYSDEEGISANALILYKE